MVDALATDGATAARQEILGLQCSVSVAAATRATSHSSSKGSDTAESTSSYFADAFSKARKENHPKRTVHASRVRVE
jgi:hypothetical protein